MLIAFTATARRDNGVMKMGRIKLRTQQGYELEFDSIEDAKAFIGVETKTAPIVIAPPKREPYVPKYIKERELAHTITTEPEKVNYPKIAHTTKVTKYWTMSQGRMERSYNWQADSRALFSAEQI
jgi:hypothetical protein